MSTSSGVYGGAGTDGSSPSVMASSYGGAGSANQAKASVGMGSDRKVNAIQPIVKDGKVIVMTILDGKPSSWVEFDPEQMDGLIEVLKAAREKI